MFTAWIFSPDLTAARWSRLKIRCFKLWGLLFSDSAVQWAENPDSDLACLFFCGPSPPAPAVGGTTSAMHRRLPDPSSSYHSHWVCITEGSLPLKCSILKFYEAILNKGLSEEVISSSCTVLFISCRMKKVKMKSNKNLIVCTSVCECVLVVQLCPTLCDPMDIARQAPLSMGFSRQEHWNGLPFPSPGIFLIQGSNLGLL